MLSSEYYKPPKHRTFNGIDKAFCLDNDPYDHPLEYKFWIVIERAHKVILSKEAHKNQSVHQKRQESPHKTWNYC